MRGKNSGCDRDLTSRRIERHRWAWQRPIWTRVVLAKPAIQG